MASATNGAPSIESSTPIIRPSPRTSRMKSNFLPSAAKPFAEFGAACAHVFEQLFALDDVEKFERGRANQRTAAKRRAMQPRADLRRDGIADARIAPSGKPAASGFAITTMSGFDVKFLIAEVAAGAAEPALNFIGDQNGAVFRWSRPARDSRIFADRMNAAFALDRSRAAQRKPCRRISIRDRATSLNFTNSIAGNQRRERQTIFLSRSRAHGAKRAPVK